MHDNSSLPTSTMGSHHSNLKKVVETPESLTPNSTAVQSSSDVRPPETETRDGFFGYSEEKTFLQIEEKIWAHRRGSDARSDGAASFKSFTARHHDIGHGTSAFLEDDEGTIEEDKSSDQFTLPKVDLPPAAETYFSAEFAPIFGDLERCMQLRDKYIARSLQRLGDNPRDHDGVFKGLDKNIADVMGARPDADLRQFNPTDPKYPSVVVNQPWKIYPKPPPPHWHWTESKEAVSGQPAYPSSSRFVFSECEIPGKHEWGFKLDDKGVYQVYKDDTVDANGSAPEFVIPTIRDYFIDLDDVLRVISDGPTKSFAYKRLRYLASKFTMYSLLNEVQEIAEMKRAPHRDFYNIRKVDTHVHHSSSMNEKHLLRFIKSKMKRSPQDVVIKRDGAELTLEQVFQSLNITSYDLSIDTLDMHAHSDSFHRFDKFNLKYNPIGETRLREIFLKTDNLIKGRYLAELTKELMTDLEQSKYQNVEWRISIYGKARDEWDKLAKWVVENKLYSHNVRWLIQVPRLYDVYKKTGILANFEQLLQNVFQPLFEVTKDPSSHPELHVFLQRVVGFDTVDDESKTERRIYKKYPFPRLWDTDQSPPYAYWIYYMYANMASLNHWRQARGFNTFVFVRTEVKRAIPII